MKREVAPRLSERDEEIIDLVDRFGLLTTSHLALLGFNLPPSHTSVKRVLGRLADRKYLTRRQSWVGGCWSGSAEYIYRLGPAGKRLLGRKSRLSSLKAHQQEHTLEIADAYADLKDAEWQGGLPVLDFTTEPSCGQAVGTELLLPDAHVELGQPDDKIEFWFEVDCDTESLPEIEAKCVRYWRAYSGGRWPRVFFPYVLFIVRDARRREQIEEVIRRGPAEAQPIFHVCLADRLVEATELICQIDSSWPPRPSWLVHELPAPSEASVRSRELVVETERRAPTSSSS